MSKLTAYAGATFSLSLTCQDSAGDPQDLTGYTARGSVRIKPNSESVTLDLAPTIPTPSNGVILILVSDETTAAITAGRYVFDVVLDTPEGDVIRIFGGTILFKNQVTKSS